MTPRVVLIPLVTLGTGTYYGGEKQNRGSWHTPHTDFARAQRRLGLLVGMSSDSKSNSDPVAMEREQESELGFYRLGDKRTLKQYVEFTGIDPLRPDASNHPLCAVMYVPWNYAGKSSSETTIPDTPPKVTINRDSEIPPTTGEAASSTKLSLSPLSEVRDHENEKSDVAVMLMSVEEDKRRREEMERGEYLAMGFLARLLSAYTLTSAQQSPRASPSP